MRQDNCSIDYACFPDPFFITRSIRCRIPDRVFFEHAASDAPNCAFPCNDFGGQEPGTNQEIKTFCLTKYGVTFKLFDKVKILGKDKNKLYAVLTDNDVTGSKDVKWNFEKFLIDENGVLIQTFKRIPLNFFQPFQ